MGSAGQDSLEAEIRPVSEGELDAWVHALDASFLLTVPDGAAAFMKELYAPGRLLGAFGAGRCLGTFRSLDLEVTVPGGGLVGAEGVTNVAVIPDCRRRGLLGRMMRAGLDDAVARGHSIAALIASEYRIFSAWNGSGASRRSTSRRMTRSRCSWTIRGLACRKRELALTTSG